MYKKLSVLLSAYTLIVMSMFGANAQAATVHVGTATNSSVPSVWESVKLDVTSFISGVSQAILSFDLRNDAPPFSAHSTTSDVWLTNDNSNFSVQLNYRSGSDTSHWRNVELLVDGKLYVDQFGSFNNHLGNADYGTAWEGLWGSGNIADQEGKGSTTFKLSADAGSVPVSGVPVPAAVWLFGSALIGLIGTRKKAVTTRVA